MRELQKDAVVLPLTKDYAISLIYQRGAEKMQKNKSPQLHHATKRTYSKLIDQLFELSEAPVSDEKISAMAS